MSLKSDFKAKFPEFDNQAIDAAWASLESLYPCFYGGSYGSGDNCDDQIILFLIAHLFQVDQSNSSALLQTSKTVGSVSVTLHVDQATDNSKSFFISTKYGQRYLLLTRHRHGACFV